MSGLSAGSCATPNQVPSARTRNVIARTGPGGTANASIDNGSFDPDGDPLKLTQSPPGPDAIGTTSVLLTFTDPKGAASQATSTVTVAPSVFTDPSLATGTSVVKAVHILELRPRRRGEGGSGSLAIRLD